MCAKTFIFVLAISCALPLWASAHASPVVYEPAASAVLTEPPKKVSASFSERVDLGASFLRVTGPAGVVSGKPSLGADQKTMVVPVTDGGEGAYTVRWSVVSVDDGHFTRGEYSFTVGAASPSGSVASFELVTASTRSEAVGMTLEFVGNGMLWAILLAFALFVRPLLSRFSTELPLLRRGYRLFGVVGIALAFAGQLIQLYVKASDLAVLNGISVFEGAGAFLSTTAGLALAGRAGAIAAFAVLFVFFGRKIFESTRMTWPEWVLASCLLVFAFFRAIISHATANPFFPELSVAANVLHLIEKDIWAGMMLVLVLVGLTPRLRTFVATVLPRANAMLSVTLALAGLTGAYIVWLHLESFGNILLTSWGEALIPLILAVALLVAARIGNTIRPRAATLGAELLFALLLIYHSGVVILTSPPLHQVRKFDTFALVMAGFAACAVVLAVVLFKRSRTAPSFAVGTPRIFAGAAAGLFVYGFISLVLPYVGLHNAFKSLCERDGNMWHFMLPMRAGTPVSETPREGCMWGMGNYQYMFADRGEYEHYRALGEAQVELTHAPELISSVPTELTVSLKNAEGKPAELFVDMEKLVHMVIVSKDQSVFAHIHAAESAQEKKDSTFRFTYAFPKAGEYLVSVDYAHGLSLRSRQFNVTVYGSAGQGEQREYPLQGNFDGYEVTLKYALPIVGEVETLRYEISKDGKPVTDLEPYLSAAMHISVVKNDFSSFMHLHGELHASGTPIVAPVVRDGKLVHNMAAMMNLPPRFGPNVEAHVIFPSTGLYTVWGEFKAKGMVVPTAFTVRVEE